MMLKLETATWQIMSIHLLGDIFDLHSLHLNILDQAVDTREQVVRKGCGR